tara:strand:+ start:1091 stop:1669 length:579 start_codon:yes stop_codon:yes gene_type:complete
MAREQSSALYMKNENIFSNSTVDFLKNTVDKDVKVLDLGCSSGELSYLLSIYCKSIIGIDYDEKLISEAKLKYKEIDNLTFKVGIIPDILKNNFEYFDLIVCSHIIEHIDDYESLLKELKKYGKKIYIEVPDFDSNDLNFLKKKLNVEPTYTDADHVREFDRAFLLNFFNKNNFKIIKEEYKDCVMRFLVEC